MVTSSAIHSANILIVDDREANVLLLERMLRRAGYVSITATVDPSKVCELHLKNRYDLILLDLEMPDMDGFQVMEGLDTIEQGGYLPVLVITAQPQHKLRALQTGAKDFISKPFDLAEVLARVHNMLEVRLLHKELHQYNDVLERRARETAALQESYQEAIFTMMRAAEHKDENTGHHVKRIGTYNRELARILGMGEEFVDRIYLASPMHDIGKSGIPDHILLKPDRFTPDEWVIMKGHTSMGANILGGGHSPCLKMGAEIALNHHERWNGGGYPNGKQGEAIPMAARIMSICDVYDALRSRRPYKPAHDHLKTVDIVMHGDDRTRPEHFDPDILAAFELNHPLFRDIFDTHTA